MADGAAQAGFAGGFARIKPLILPAMLIGSLLVIMVPLPAMVMDMLLAANITVAVIVLLTTIYVQTPLEFSIFPSLLLATTLGRLVLNVATTRMILTRADSDGMLAGGGVIKNFGEFVAVLLAENSVPIAERKHFVLDERQIQGRGNSEWVARSNERTEMLVLRDLTNRHDQRLDDAFRKTLATKDACTHPLEEAPAGKDGRRIEEVVGGREIAIDSLARHARGVGYIGETDL